LPYPALPANGALGVLVAKDSLPRGSMLPQDFSATFRGVPRASPMPGARPLLVIGEIGGFARGRVETRPCPACWSGPRTRSVSIGTPPLLAGDRGARSNRIAARVSVHLSGRLTTLRGSRRSRPLQFWQSPGSFRSRRNHRAFRCFPDGNYGTRSHSGGTGNRHPQAPNSRALPRVQTS